MNRLYLETAYFLGGTICPNVLLSLLLLAIITAPKDIASNEIQQVPSH